MSVMRIAWVLIQIPTFDFFEMVYCIFLIPRLYCADAMVSNKQNLRQGNGIKHFPPS